MDKSHQLTQSNNLLLRTISALVLIPLLLLAIFYAKPWLWVGVGFGLTILAAREYNLLIPLRSIILQTGFFLLLVLCSWFCGLVYPYWQTVGLTLWLLILVAEISFPQSQKYWGFPIVVCLMALVLWPIFMQSLAKIYELPMGKALIVYLLCLVWAADIGAYFVGKILGAHKLIPQLSPGKSREGVLGGILLGMVVAAVAFKYFSPYSALIWFSLAVVTLISTVVGDLCISMFKRRCNLKDTGTLIPGHGGILDRLDSLIAAAPVFYLGLAYIPIGI